MRAGRPSHLVCTVLLTLTVTAGRAAVAAQVDARPPVRLIATGGTIANQPGGRLTASDLVASIPQLDRYVDPEAEQFTNVTSNALTLGDWLSLARRVNTVLDQRPDLHGIVVTTGTDTLEETAFFLHLTVSSHRPVVVVGSMRRPSALGYDGGANLLQAFRVAADPDSEGRGVLVVLNNDVHSARDVTKTDAQALHTFSSGNTGVLGIVDAGGVVYHRRIERRHTVASEFDVDAISSLPRVDVLLSYQGAPGDLMLSAVDAGARGIVLAATGAGGASPSQRQALRRLAREGIPVVVTTRTGGGRIVPYADLDDADDRDTSWPPQIAGQDLSPVKARVLLMLALTRTDDRDELQRIFSEY